MRKSARWRSKNSIRGDGEGHSRRRHRSGTPTRVVVLMNHRGTSPATNGRILATASQSRCSAAEKAKASPTVENAAFGSAPIMGAWQKDGLLWRRHVITGTMPAQRNARVANGGGTLEIRTFPGSETLRYRPAGSH